MTGSDAASGRGPRPSSDQIESDHGLVFSLEHDLFGKPASTFPDHALAETSRAQSTRPLFAKTTPPARLERQPGMANCRHKRGSSPWPPTTFLAAETKPGL